MSDKNEIITPVEEAQDPALCTLQELAQRGLLKEDFIVACIDHDVTPVVGDTLTEWRFSTTAVVRLHKAWRLHRDLGLHVDNLALVLDLLDERDDLVREITTLRYRLHHWEE